MWVTAFFGTTLKYAECTLSVKYREINSQGFTAGGPMYTIENGMGKQWKWLAIAFAGFAIICSFATGNAIQSFTVSDQIYSESLQLFGPDHFLTMKRSFLDLFQFSFQQVLNGIIRCCWACDNRWNKADRSGNWLSRSNNGCYLCDFCSSYSHLSL